VSGLDELLANLSDDMVVVALPDGGDPFAAISVILEEAGSVESIHLITHGGEGQLQFGDRSVTAVDLEAESDEIGKWAQYLTVDADILLYGCNVAANGDGQGFVDSLARLSGADVAASIDLTGATALGGDWDLEVQIGEITTTVLDGEGYFDSVLTTAMDAASSNFSEVLKGTTFDPGQDIQAQAAIDLTGDGSNAMLYMKYDDQGTAGDTSDDELYIRLRTDQSLDNNDKFNGYAWMGMDVDSDGDLDAFLMAIGTSQGFSINIYNGGSGANTSPSTTELDSSPSQTTALISNETITVSETSGGDFISSSSTSHMMKKVADVDGGTGDADSDGNADYFLTFKVNADNFFSTVNGKKITGGGGALISSLNGGSGIDKGTSLRFVVATAQNDNALNGDMGGINDKTADLTATYESLGLFVTGSLGNPENLSSGSGNAPSVTVGNLSFTEGDGATAIDGSATASDSDGDSDWDTNAKLEVQITANGTSNDQLAIATSGNFSISSGNLSYTSGGTTTVIGTISESSGTANDGTVSGSSKLTVNFNSNATNAIVQELSRSITFNNTSENPDTTSRTVTFTVTDKNGSTGTDTSTISVARVNDAPTGADKTLTTTEDTAKVLQASDFGFSDPDGDTLSKVKITTLETAGALQYFDGTNWTDVTLNQEITKADIDGGKLRFNPASGASGSPYTTFQFQVHDGTTYSSSSYTITMNVTAVNDAPDIKSNGGGSTAEISVEEGKTTVTTVTATDPENDTLSFSITGGADQNKFNIDPNTGALTFKTAPDYENPTDDGANNTYIVQVTVSDGNGGTTVQTITVTVTDKDETPAFVPPPTVAAPPPPPPPPPPAFAPTPVITTLAPPAPVAPPPGPPAPTPVAGPPVVAVPAVAAPTTLVFGGAGASEQTVQDVAVSVTATSNIISNTDTVVAGNTQSGTGEDGSAAIQSYVISAKDNSGNGKVTIAVDGGLPPWMKITADGDETMVLTGERPEGDDSTYQVKIKMKRLDGEEIDAIITVAPVAKQNEAPSAGGPNEGQPTPESAPENDQASIDWMREFLASLDAEKYPNGQEGHPIQMQAFADQLAIGYMAKEAWSIAFLNA